MTFLASRNILELFGRLVPRCITIYSLGDGQKSHFEAIFFISWRGHPPMKCWFSLYFAWGATPGRGKPQLALNLSKLRGWTIGAASVANFYSNIFSIIFARFLETHTFETYGGTPLGRPRAHAQIWGGWHPHGKPVTP